MAEMKDIVKVAVDAYHGNVEQYSVGQSMELQIGRASCRERVL